MVRIRLNGASRGSFVFTLVLCSLLFFLKFFFSAPHDQPLLVISLRTPALGRSRFFIDNDKNPTRTTTKRTPRLVQSFSSPLLNSRSVKKSLYNLVTTVEKRNATRATMAADDTAAKPQKPPKKKLTLFVAILSAPIRIDRREGIRATWLNDCDQPEVVCRFFTDPISEMKPHVAKVLLNESRVNKDLQFMQVPRGYNFGRRILWLMDWSAQKYDFDYLLRVDDDYFVCLRRLLFELPQRPPKRLYWGHVHCAVEGLVRVDEGFLILSSDLVHEFLARKKTLLCHPFGDQTVALWINEAKNVTYFHDPRVHHDVTSLKPQFKAQREICQTYLSLHGSYLHEMLTYWDIVSKEKSARFWIPSVEPLGKICPLSVGFDWRAMEGPPYGWEPKPCRLNPVWEIGEMHRGRNMI